MKRCRQNGEHTAQPDRNRSSRPSLNGHRAGRISRAGGVHPLLCWLTCAEAPRAESARPFGR
ncbi:hypothetical protein H4W80_010584 [Nonomuraea angiospora]|uniref:Uncharacterized protein n=1 Tax=Nonomuraea angiospora TaxID=46172 RepID=A0ABR9MHC1_9ACTN|nr:hypothetical protein [Nonomuraea angiospora]